MIERGILYHEVIDLGFKREDQSDNIFFKENGYEWFLVTKKLSKGLYLDWDCETHRVELIRWVPKDGDILNRRTLVTVEEIKDCIEFFTTKQPKKKEVKAYFTATPEFIGTTVA
jgi:hypothetical protein